MGEGAEPRANLADRGLADRGLADSLASAFRRFAKPVAGALIGMALLSSPPAAGGPIEPDMDASRAGAVVAMDTVDVDRLQVGLDAPDRPVMAPSTIEVRRGDTMAKLAERYGVTVDDLLGLNPEVRNPNLIRIGQTLRVPPEQGELVHIVRRGDNLHRIAGRYRVDVDDVIALNPDLRDPNLIVPGERIRVRAASPAVAEVETSAASTGVAPAPAPAPRESDRQAATREVEPATVGAVRPASPDRVPEASNAGEERSVPSPERVAELGVLRPGRADPAAVRVAQDLLTQLGYLGHGQSDGKLGTRTITATAAFQYEHGLHVDGIVGPQTWGVLLDPDTKPAETDSTRTYRPGDRYPPRSRELTALLRAAAPLAGVPKSWAIADSLHELIERESNGRVGLPNYTYGGNRGAVTRMVGVHADLRAGRIRAASSATGLGQLLLSNVDRHYPSGRDGIGVPIEEAAGMMGYIKERYGHPDVALRSYGVYHEGY